MQLSKVDPRDQTWGCKLSIRPCAMLLVDEPSWVGGPEGVHPQTAYRWFRAGTLPVPARKMGKLILVGDLDATHGVIVVEGLDAAGMLRQKGLPGARVRRRGLSDAALGEMRRQLVYKCPFYESTLMVADRFFPSSKSCSACGHVQDLGSAEHWSCGQCSAEHHRDDNAAVNLARLGDLGSVGAPVTWNRASDWTASSSWRGHAKGRLGTHRAEQLREECSVSAHHC